MEMFEKAVREKIRFNYRGNIGVEELWDLPLDKLDYIYGQLETALEGLPKKSLLSDSSKERQEIEFKQAVIKYIVDVKKEEAQQRARSKENADKKQLILSLIEEKKNEGLRNLSIEELTKIAEDL